MRKLSGTCTTAHNWERIYAWISNPKLRVKHSDFPAFLEGARALLEGRAMASGFTFSGRAVAERVGRAPCEEVEFDAKVR